MKAYGDVIKDWRKSNKLTQAQLGTMLGVTRGTVTNWESGKQIPNADDLIIIADKLGVSVDYLNGLISCEIPDDKLSPMAKYTGLSEEAITRLNEWKADGTTEVIDFLIRSDNQTMLFWWLSEFLDISASENETHSNEDKYISLDYDDTMGTKLSRSINKYEVLKVDLMESIGDLLATYSTDWKKEKQQRFKSRERERK